jgi:ring-1,2-phenylacetyl-CoA epoxidase subunit PaaE
MATFHNVTIKEIKQETANAVSVVFDIPEALKEAFSFTPGQYITLKTSIADKEVRRAYSICSTPQSGELRVAIKKVENGTFSVYATEQLKVGDKIEITPPEGKFQLQPESNKNYIGFAAGSGITPILSILKTVLETEETSTFTLIYGNKSIDDTIFYEELISLKEKYQNFNLEFVCSQEQNENMLFGRIDKAYTNLFVKNRYKEVAFDAAYLCGPEAMINTVSETLEDNGFSKNSINFELFTASTEEVNTNEVKEGTSEITILLDDEETTISMSQTDNILAAALRNDLDAPYSCQGGICSSCMAKVTEGKAVMSRNSILTDDEVEEGVILTCIAHPVTPKVIIDWDDV